jgi:type II secretory pathway pseudopilin PulG
MSNQFGPPQTPHAPPPKPSRSAVPVVLIVVLALLVPGAICGVLLLAAILLPAVQAAREAVRIEKSSQNLRQIGVALHDYHDAFLTLPPAFIPDAAGKPRTSWRTLILPYLEQKPLSDRYDFRIAWDDPQNAAVGQTPLAIFHSPRDPSRLANRTSYVVITCTSLPGQRPDTAFAGARAPRFADFRDGTTNTIVVVEIKNSDIQWSEPRDVDLESLSTDPSAPNSIDLAGGALVLFCDGSTRLLPRGTTLETLKALLTPGGMEMVQP